MRQTLVIANWKMHGGLQANQALIQLLLAELGDTSGVSIAVCPPYPYLASVSQAISSEGLLLGAQNVSTHDQGAFTGEVSSVMLKEMGCRYVLVGHSERRTLFQERDAAIAEKFSQLQSQGLIPVLCIGETLEQRQQGQTTAVVQQQIQAVVERVGIESFSRAVIAYEPIWAIGTGETASAEQAEEVHGAIRHQLSAQNLAVAQSLPILYGGSVKAENAAALFSQPNIDGGLVGGASLDGQGFAQICRAAQLANAQA